MKNTNHLIQKWAGGFAILLAVASITGCQSAKPQASTNASDSVAATPATPAPAETPAATPAQPAAPTAAPETSVASAVGVTNAVAVTPPVRIKAGVTDNMKDSEGNVWVADEGFADGETYEAPDANV